MTPTTKTSTCKRGHALVGDNVYHRRDGGRRCRACKRERDAARYVADRELYRERANARYWAKREEALAQQREYYSANREAVRARQAEYRDRNREAIRERSAARYAENREEILARQREYRDRVRRETFRAYGTECRCCGEATERFLTIDHVENNGSEHRRELGRGGVEFYQWLRGRGWPKGYQTLCWNCNVGRAINGHRCPHVAPVEEPRNSGQRQYREVRAQALKEYGSRCLCCGEDRPTFLAVVLPDDMRNGWWDRAGWTRLWRLRADGWPSGPSVHCLNCAMGRVWNGAVCPHEEPTTPADAGPDRP